MTFNIRYRQMWRAGDDRSEFDPHSGFTFLKQRRPRRRSYGLLKKSNALEYLDAMHEQVHWGQLISFSLGRTQTELRRRRDAALVEHLRSLCKPLKGVSFLDSRYPRPLLPTDNVVNHWCDAKTDAQRTFYESLIADSVLLGLPSVGVCEESMSATLSAFAKTDGLLVGIRRAEIDHFVKRFLETKPQDIQFNKKSLTTVSLFECGAYLIEFIFMSKHMTESDHEARAVKLDGTYYFAPLYLADSVLGKDITNPIEGREAMFATLIAIDMALQTPCPPTASLYDLSWSEIYPPVRFFKALTAIKKIGVCSEEIVASKQDFQKYIDEILHESRLSCARTDVMVPSKIDKFYNHQTGELDVSQADGNVTASYYDFMSFIHNLAQREINGGGLLYHTAMLHSAVSGRGGILTGKDVLKEIRESERLGQVVKQFVFSAPFVVYNETKLVGGGAWPERLWYTFLISSIGQYQWYPFATETSYELTLPGQGGFFGKKAKEAVLRSFEQELEMIIMSVSS